MSISKSCNKNSGVTYVYDFCYQYDYPHSRKTDRSALKTRTGIIL